MERSQIREYIGFMRSYADFLEKAAEGEKEKYASLLSYNRVKTEKVVSEQQAMNMKLNELEDKRIAFQEKMGCKGLSSQQIAEKFDGEDKDELKSIVKEFEESVNTIKYFNRKSLLFVNEGLGMINAGIEKQGVTYGSDGKKPGDSVHSPLFEKEI